MKPGLAEASAVGFRPGVESPGGDVHNIVGTVKSGAARPRSAWLADVAELVKARLNALSLLTTLAGFYLGWAGHVNLWLLAHTLLGTMLVAAGSAALNQLIERGPDAKMHRTRERPLPAGRMTAEVALGIGCLFSVVGLLELALAVNLLSASLAAVTLGVYLFVYTPLKRRTTLNTLVGAVPGALPPLLGWAAARGTLDAGGWALFGILFCWQMPHFLPIAWLHREDYARGGFVMLPSVDPDGRRTGWQAVNYAFLLLLVSLTPTLLGVTTPAYFFAAFALGTGLLAFAVRLLLDRSAGRARQLFFASIIYLPLLLAALALCKAS